MATNLYETLEVSKDATPEQIRKGYRRRALQTHPDRLPPTATAEEKAASEEQFRKVNNAYEILSDPQNRRIYDLHGAFPAPEPEEVPYRDGRSRDRYSRPHRHSPFDDHFADPFFFGHRDPFVFTDPFTLFESIFGDFHPFRPNSRFHSSSLFDDFFDETDPMDAMMANAFGRSMFPPMGMSRGLLPLSGNFPTIMSPAFSERGRGQWAGESFVSTTVNGRTETVHKRHDWEGNEHVTRTYGDGREIHTVNGVEQPGPRGYLPTPPSDVRRMQSSAVTTQPRGSGSRSNATPPYPPPPYPGQSSVFGHAGAEPSYDRRRDHRYSDIPNPGPYNDRHEDRHRKRWWPSGW